ncbi:MAG TPA: Gfo/Idh/MocA family oxidoreductase [Gemmatimonadaceae bacterium]
MTPQRCAIVGAGLMGRWHAQAARRAGVEVVFVIDAEHERARRLASMLQLPVSAATTSLADALSPDACDAVHICTPLHTHVELAREALEADRHVLVEKPLAESADETAELLALAGQRGLQIVPVHQFLFQRGVERALRALPELGPVLHFEAIACSAGADAFPAEERDRVVLEILPHAFALAGCLVTDAIGDVEWVAVDPGPGELRLLGESGRATISIVVSMSGRPTRSDATLICTSGTVHLNLFHGYAVIERGAPSRMQKIFRPFGLTTSTLAAASLNLGRRAVSGESAYPGLRELVSRFYQAARGGGPPPITAAEALSVARARDRVTALLAGKVS